MRAKSEERFDNATRQIHKKNLALHSSSTKLYPYYCMDEIKSNFPQDKMIPLKTNTLLHNCTYVWL